MLEKEKLCRNVVEIINTDQLVPIEYNKVRNFEKA